MSGDDVNSVVNLKERLAYDEDFKTACINAYKYLKERKSYTEEAFKELVGIKCEMPVGFIGYLKTLIFR